MLKEQHIFELPFIGHRWKTSKNFDVYSTKFKNNQNLLNKIKLQISTDNNQVKEPHCQ